MNSLRNPCCSPLRNFSQAHCLPPNIAELMRDPQGVISDFYPRSFGLDLNGKHAKWAGVALLPFIDERRLLAAAVHKDPCRCV